MASLILGNVGSALLGPIGGFIGSAIGSLIDQWLFAPKPEDIEGPRLEDLSAGAANPGSPIPLVYGADRIPGIVIQTTDLIETAHTKRVGGKGGGGQKQTTYTYHVDIAYLLCEGPILGVGRIWADGKLLRGTRYQMELDTEENFEQIGGIPYNDWYKNNIYDPSGLYWDTLTNVNPDIDPQHYQWSEATGFIPITDTYAAYLLAETKEVVYKKDTARNLYIPTSESHGYTGEVLKEGPSLDVICVSATGGTPAFSVPPTAQNEPVTVVYDLVEMTDGLILDPDDDTVSADNVFGYAVLSQPVTITDPPQPIDLGWVGLGSVSAAAGVELSYLGGVVAGVSGGIPGSHGSDHVTVYTPGNQGGTEASGPASDTLSVGITLHKNYRYLVATFHSAKALAFSTTLKQNENGNGTITVSGCAPRVTENAYRDWPDYFNFYDAINDWSPKSVLEYHGADDVQVYRGYPDQPVDPVLASISPSGDAPAYRCLAYIRFDRLELEQFGNRIPSLTFEVVQSDNARVVDVLDDILCRAGVDQSNYDLDLVPTTGEESYVHGYTIGKITSFRAAMEPMLEAFRLDAAEIGSELVFRPKRRNPDYTIDWNDLDAHNSGGSAGAAIRLSFRDVVEMPRTLGLRYKDPEREYQPSTANFQRQIGRSVQQSVIELGAVLPPHRMKTLVRDKMRDLWFERQSAAWSLPHKYLYISPSDIVQITGSPNGTYDQAYKITQLTRRSDGILEMEGVNAENELYVPADGENTRATTDRWWENGQEVYGLSGLSYIQVWDLPPLLNLEQTDEYNLSGVVIGVGGTGGRWPGATVYWDVNYLQRPTVTEEEIEEISAQAVMGSLLVNAYTETNYLNNRVYGGIDRDSEIYVYLNATNQVLESVTDNELLNGRNAAVIGGEIVCFKDVLLMDDGSYRLTNFVRGLFDTIDYSTTHGPLEDFMLLDERQILFHNVPVDARGEKLRYFATTFGDTFIDENTYDGDGNLVNRTQNSREITFAANRLKPFRPVMIQGTRDGSNNISVRFIRQDRHFTGMSPEGDYDRYTTENGFLDFPFEADVYAVDETSDPLNPVPTGPVLRTIQVAQASDSALWFEAFQYTAAQQVADGITPGNKVHMKIYQISSTVGRGNAGTGTF